MKHALPKAIGTMLLGLGLLATAPHALAGSPRQAAKELAAPQVTLIFGGDIMLDDGPGQTIAAGGDPLAPLASLLSQADYRIGNLECPIAASNVGTATASKIYNFRAHPDSVRVLKGRFDALSVANNHSGDYGPAAFLETLRNVHESGIASFGGGADLAQAHRPLWIRQNGLTIAVLGYNEFKPRSFEAGAQWPGIAWSEDSHVITDIRAARQAGADLVIPFMHWGWERETSPSKRQRQLARTMIDAGADLVVGGHPHVTQGTEYYRGKLIVYSLGNLVFDGFTSPTTTTGWLLRLTLDKQGLKEWATRTVHMDDKGTPYPRPEDRSPCGKAGDAQAALCANGAW